MSKMLIKELEKTGRLKSVPNDKKPTVESLKRLDSEIASKNVIHKGPVF